MDFGLTAEQPDFKPLISLWLLISNSFFIFGVSRILKCKLDDLFLFMLFSVFPLPGRDNHIVSHGPYLYWLLFLLLQQNF